MEKIEYAYPENVDYLSGFGVNSGYELECQKMALQGFEFLRENPEERKIIFDWFDIPPEDRKWGEVEEPNAMKLWEKAITADTDGITGAMFGAARQHAYKMEQLGFDEYLRQLAEYNKEDDGED